MIINNFVAYIDRSGLVRRQCKLSNPRFDNLIVYGKLWRPFNRLANRRWTDSTFTMSCLSNEFHNRTKFKNLCNKSSNNNDTLIEHTSVVRSKGVI